MHGCPVLLRALVPLPPPPKRRGNQISVHGNYLHLAGPFIVIFFLMRLTTVKQYSGLADHDLHPSFIPAGLPSPTLPACLPFLAPPRLVQPATPYIANINA